MNPYSAALFQLPSCINLPIKEVGDGLVVEGDMTPGANLFDKLYVFDQQQIVAG